MIIISKFGITPDMVIGPFFLPHTFISMADLSEAIKDYCKKHKSKSSLHGFVNNSEHHKELITTWFETFITYEDSMNSLIRKFKKIYKDLTKANYKSKSLPDLSSLFTQSELQKSTMKNGARVLNEAIDTTAKNLIIRLKLRPKTAPVGPTTPSSSSSNESYVWAPCTNNESNASSSSAGRDLDDPSSNSPSLSAPSTTKVKLNQYIEICKDKANKHGFNLQTEIHQVLASKGIILLKKGQFCSELVRYIDAESLLNNIQSAAVNRDIKVDTKVYLTSHITS
ncbi:unnamed protein product [Mucor hiemalis]